jgi:hypothetical protein
MSVSEEEIASVIAPLFEDINADYLNLVSSKNKPLLAHYTSMEAFDKTSRDAEDAAASNYNTASKGTVTPLAIWDKKIASIRQRISELAMYAGFDEQ